MEELYFVAESGSWEFTGTLTECQAYIVANQFKNSFFIITKF